MSSLPKDLRIKQFQFKKKINMLCEEAKHNKICFGLILLDINRYKYLKGYLGHEIAEALIVKIVDSIISVLDAKLSFYRYSEDQLAFLVEEKLIKDKCENIARKIINKCSDTYTIDNYELNIAVNIGIYISTGDEQDSNNVIKSATYALMKSKEKSDNNYSFFSKELDIEYNRQFVLRNDLCKAIERKQLKVYYQPQINLVTNEIVGAEALVRWRHPVWGLIPPNDFIYIAEESSYVIDIGKWVLREVCINYKQWIQAGLPPIHVSINYSSKQFCEKHFVENLLSIICKYQLDPGFLIIEIIESVLIDNYDQIISNIQKLHNSGIKVAIDDFGTGFSSLEYLNKLNIDIIKIDKSFIQNALEDKTTSVITSSIINMARNLDIALVAEGIETIEQLSYLQSLNCHYGQGYLFHRPATLQEFEILLAKKKCVPVINDAIQERRIYSRIIFPELIKTDMIIYKNRNRRYKRSNIEIFIKDISLGGLCFMSDIKLPLKNDMLLQFNIRFPDKEIELYGYPVWAERINQNRYLYGIKFPADCEIQKDLSGALIRYLVN